MPESLTKHTFHTATETFSLEMKCVMWYNGPLEWESTDMSLTLFDDYQVNDSIMFVHMYGRNIDVKELGDSVFEDKISLQKSLLIFISDDCYNHYYVGTMSSNEILKLVQPTWFIDSDK